MDTFTLFGALLFGLAGLLLTSYLLISLLSIVLGNFGGLGNLRGWRNRSKLKKRQALLKEADELLENDQVAQALARLKGAFCYEVVTNDSELLDKFSNQNLGALVRLVTVSQKTARHSEALPEVEKLLQERAQLSRLLLERLAARIKLKSRSKKEGKGSTPEWALKEFDQQIAQITNDLSTNFSNLERQISKLFKALSTVEKIDDDVTYH